MKHVVNFRLSTHTINVLAILEKKLQDSKTAIVEKAVQSYAKKELAKQNLILNYAGVIDNQDADEILNSIKQNKNNKDIQIDL